MESVDTLEVDLEDARDREVERILYKPAFKQAIARIRAGRCRRSGSCSSRTRAGSLSATGRNPMVGCGD
jgi:hypothetical protein